MYKVLYRLFGGYVSDVVAAIDQVHYMIYPNFSQQTHLVIRFFLSANQLYLILQRYSCYAEAGCNSFACIALMRLLS